MIYMHPGGSILWVLIGCYIIFFLVSCFAWKENQLNIDGRSGLVNSLNGINLKNLSGIVLFGLPLVLYFKLWAHLFLLSPGLPSRKMLVFLLLIIAVGQLALMKAKKRSKDSVIRERDREQLAFPAVRWYLFIRICFLIVYECFFRGLLLFVCAGIFGAPSAVVINMIFYTGIHVFNGRWEMLSCIPFGLLLCGMVLWNQSVLPAVALHLVLALVYENHLIFSLDQPKTLTS